MTTAAARWRAQLASWAIPDDVRAAGPTGDPWELRVASFVDHALDVDPDTTSNRLAREALGTGGTVLDVGCGAGAATVGLGAGVTRATGVDERDDMLEAFHTVMARREIPADTITGRWPDVSSAAPDADLVLSHHVAWNVPDLGGFLLALDAHARRRVVVELPDEHPRAWTSPYWAAVHDLDRPTGPTGTDAVAVAREVGLEPHVEVEQRPGNRLADRERRLDHLMGHLCLHPDQRPQLEAVDDAIPPPGPRRILTLWWDV